MNNKGQSLTIFIIIIPIIFAIFAFTFDYAYIIYNQQRYENISKNIIEQTTELEEIKILYVKNKYSIDNLKYTNNGNEIKISNTYYIKSIFGNILNIKNYKCEINYIVRVENNDIIVEENKGA